MSGRPAPSQAPRPRALVSAKSRALLIMAAIAAMVTSGGLAAVSCRGIVLPNEEEEYMPVVNDFCFCWKTFSFDFDSEDDCVKKMDERLRSTEGKVLADWLSNYVNQCRGPCEKAPPCYYQLPVCAYAECNRDEECCSYDGDAGACQDSGQCTAISGQ